MRKLRRVLEHFTQEIHNEFPLQLLQDIWNDPSLSDEGND